ncbi:MAG: rhodanese-like domain-containing protein [Thiomicrorhabdus sp.]|jgi:rhodanese-related sulfurtransferase|nr:rhodanese-like domain-containing protein [Thiomicrorhabdus sp.]
MKKQTLVWLAAATVSGIMASSMANASPEPTDPKKHTPQGLYIDAKETIALMEKDPKVILVDVRTPEEWQFVGYTEAAQIMVPSIFFKYDAMDDKKPRYRDVVNDNFVSELEDKAADLGAYTDTTYILMCRSGATRAQPAAKMLAQYGYKNVYIMTDGFEGSKTKDGDKKGFRLKNGWKNSGQPWTYKIDAKKTYFVK